MLRDREHGGRLLGRELGRLRSENPIVFGVARGGVPVALEVARALEAPLDVLAVERLGADEFPEYTVGAVAEGGAVCVRRDVLHEVGMTEGDAVALAGQAGEELGRRARAYRGDAEPPDLEDRTVVVVDDGVATGATAGAAVREMRARGAPRVVLAAPVIAAAAEPDLRHEYDQVVALEWPRPFQAVGVWYERLEPVSDDEVVECLRRGREILPKREADRIWEGEAAGAGGERSAAPLTETLAIPCAAAPGGFLEADLVVPRGAAGVVVFSTGSIRESPRFRVISRALHRAGVGRLRCDLLTSAERRAQGTRLPLDARQTTSRIGNVIRWMSGHPALRGLHRGLYGAVAGAEAALAAVAAEPALVDAVVVRAGHLDAVATLTLASIRAPVLLVVGSRDQNVLSANHAALAHLSAADLAVVPGATETFEEPGALDAVGRLAAGWFRAWLERAAALGPARPLEVVQDGWTVATGG